MKTVSLKLAESLDYRLAATAKERGTTKSELLREAIQTYLDEEAPHIPGSCLDLADDVIGCTEGPPDLSVNGKYLEGFGA